jgi:hypothetical protein
MLDDFFDDTRLKKFDLEKAAAAPTKSREDLNIEALCATPEGNLLIGFRAPIPDCKALLVPLRNPKDLMSGSDSHAHLGEPILLDLGGRGFRDMAPWRGGYLTLLNFVGFVSVAALIFFGFDCSLEFLLCTNVLIVLTGQSRWSSGW